MSTVGYQNNIILLSYVIGGQINTYYGFLLFLLLLLFAWSQWSYLQLRLFCPELEYVVIYKFSVLFLGAKFVSVLFKSLSAPLGNDTF